MKKYKILILCGIIFSFGCEKKSDDKLIYNLNESDTFTSDEYEIYNLIVNPYTPKLDTVFIDQKTAYVYIDSLGLKKIDGLNELLIQEYKSKKNVKKYLDENSFSNENNIVLIPDTEKDRNTFNEIYNSQQGRFLSNIGFNENLTEAIVGAVDRIDCGMIYYTYYLEKENNNWIIIWNSMYGITCN